MLETSQIVPPPPAPAFIRNMRLLVVADSSTTHTHRWAQWFASRGARVTVLSHVADEIAGVEVTQFPSQRRWYHSIPRLRVLMDRSPFLRLVRQLDPQLIHFHFVSEGGRALYWNGVNIPMVASTWGQDVIFDTGPHRGAEASLREMLGRCRLITATTYQLARATARYAPNTQAIYVIPFGVDLARFYPAQCNDRQAVVLGFVKHLLPKYGPDVLIEAFALIHALRPNTRLVLAGRGFMHDALCHRIAELGLTRSVQLAGRVPHEQVPELMRGFDILVMPSIYHSETFGVAAIEASATGLPVVASDVGGVPEAVVDGVTGLLVPPRDVASLAHACIRLIDDPDLRQKFGRAGRRFVEANFSWPANACQMEEIYRAALENTPPTAIPLLPARPE